MRWYIQVEYFSDLIFVYWWWLDDDSFRCWYGLVMMLDIDYFERLSYCVSDLFDISSVVLQSYWTVDHYSAWTPWFTWENLNIYTWQLSCSCYWNLLGKYYYTVTTPACSLVIYSCYTGILFLDILYSCYTGTLTFTCWYCYRDYYRVIPVI